MAKSNRGRSIWKMESRSRGICPVCHATRVKLLYAKTKSDRTQIKVCKKCSNADASKIDAAIPTSQLAYRRKHRKTFDLQFNSSK
ncbi:hypothetical protein DFQ01_1394 [Paenibacillus cellulosilyticus]|uniref:Uncharacterized protein n=1 Tax=Paenibacillus cellulosilyticus TaxID=375489 RepID=A0A2V2YEP0_9BACL|nr:hypothetical protein [Paenibacillus cellulosilyticus]PWV90954.1 hypothetical protein DFQ01_1394 [Paenibacillus cellulosilyticus]